MRVYANLIPNLVLFDLPRTKYDQISIFKKLLILDHLPDDDLGSVLLEVGKISLMPDPAFSIFFNNDFEKYISLNKHHARWQKVKKDYNYYTQWEIKRRNKENPYFPEYPNSLSTWDELPDFSKEKKNRPYQFDLLYRDAQFLAGIVSEVANSYEKLKDKDLFQAKVNSILIPNKIVFAASGKDNTAESMKGGVSLVNIKISLDAYKQAYLFLGKLTDSLNKLKWSYHEAQDALNQALLLTSSINARVVERVQVLEKNFILYLESDLDEE